MESNNRYRFGGGGDENALELDGGGVAQTWILMVFAGRENQQRRLAACFLCCSCCRCSDLFLTGSHSITT